MAYRKAARFAAASVLTLVPVVVLAGSAQAKLPPGGGCTVSFQDEIHPGLSVEAYNYTVCTGANGSWTRTNGPSYILRNGVLVSGSTTGAAPYVGNSGPGYADYTCNGSASTTYYLYGPGVSTAVACG